MVMVPHESHQSENCAIEALNVWRVYELGGSVKIQALQGVCFQIQMGEFVVVKGRSGSGKTTLLNCIGGLDRPTSGIVRVFDQTVSEFNERELTGWRRVQVGFVFQSFGLLPTLSAYENVELALRIARYPGKDRPTRTWHCLKLVGLERWAQHRPYELSGGQQQRVSIARALANQPRLLLADEPTGELDSASAREILRLIRQITEEAQVTCVMASHDPLVDSYADRILKLKDGQVVL